MCEVEIMKDIVGNPINIGDKVAYNPPHYKGLKQEPLLASHRKVVEWVVMQLKLELLK